MSTNDRQRLRRFIQEAFSDQSLSNFCFDYFPQVYNNFTTGMAKDQKVRMLVARAESSGRLRDLHAALKRENRRAYDNAFPQGETPAQPSAEPTTQRNPRQIFLSHASEDADFAQKLAADLRRHEWHIWMAPDSIQPGEKWVEAINRGLAESGVFVLMLTASAVKSRWVQTETNAAIGMEHRGEVRLLPIGLEPVDAPAVWQAYQWIPFAEDYSAGLEGLLAILQPEAMAEIRRLYRRAQQATEQAEWQQVVDLCAQIETQYPAYRDTDALTAQARKQLAQAQQRRAAAEKLYGQLQLALTAEEWEQALALADQLEKSEPGYRDSAQLAAEARQGQLNQQQQVRLAAQQAEAARLYPQLQVAVEAEDWSNALTLAGEIEAQVPDYRDVAALAARARRKQRALRWEQQPLLRWLRQLPPIAWAGGAGVVALVLLVVFWPDGAVEAEVTPVQTQAAVAQATSTETPTIPPADAELGDTWTRPKDSMVMVYVPPPDAPLVLESGVAAPTEGFWIDKYEVSNAQYQMCVDAGVCEPSSYVDDEDFNGAEYPVVGVSFFDAEAYSEWVGGEIPTEGQWEYAAVSDSGFDYPWGNEFDGTLLNYCDTNCEYSWREADADDGYQWTAPVDSFPDGASWVGALNMSGNVWEWTASWSDEEETRRVLRGGSWFSYRDLARAASRGDLDVVFRDLRVSGGGGASVPISS